MHCWAVKGGCFLLVSLNWGRFLFVLVLWDRFLFFSFFLFKTKQNRSAQFGCFDSTLQLMRHYCLFSFSLPLPSLSFSHILPSLFRQLENQNLELECLTLRFLPSLNSISLFLYFYFFICSFISLLVSLLVLYS